MIIIGIDPGQLGGIAALCDEPEEGDVPRIFPTPKTEGDISWQIESLGGSFAYIEHVHSFPKQGVASTWKFAQNYGFLRGCLVTLGIPFEEVSPMKWQKAMGLLVYNKKLTKTQKKNRNKQKAQQLFPGLKLTHATADAILIAEYGRRLRNAK